ncbi:hypothetical protein V1525DRAFT_401923 [Lipomyces kononenkoae]|uniref:Uncharacterized protein n=1 Tax=Lipomyces kononenkoae TaxID=34357 RepID=A0ACC3T2U1_LIPKO
MHVPCTSRESYERVLVARRLRILAFCSMFIGLPIYSQNISTEAQSPDHIYMPLLDNTVVLHEANVVVVLWIGLLIYGQTVHTTSAMPAQSGGSEPSRTDVP